MTHYRTAKVFVPGGLPEYTYVPRSARGLETRLQTSMEDDYKLVAVTGATKAGKTVLATKVFPREATVWIDGGAVREEDDLWNQVLDALGGFSATSETEQDSKQLELTAAAEAEGKVPFFAAGKAGGSVSRATGQSDAISRARSVSPRTAAVDVLRRAGVPLIIDDFHYLSREVQGAIVRALKPLIFEGLPCTVIAIPHRRYDAIRVEREITGRLESISIPPWSEEELREIGAVGFPLLNIHVTNSVLQRLAQEAYGSPHLMQEFCKALAIVVGVRETVATEVVIDSVDDSLFAQVAEGTGKVVFDRLARGPRQRTDRIQRPLKAGGAVDIYEIVLLALAHLKPGLETIEYEALRSAVRDLLADDVPAAHEVSRVLEKMSEIATSDESSTPVLDWDPEERVLHITDPFFAFFLKWGKVRDSASGESDSA
jgi:hypothetical protein